MNLLFESMKVLLVTIGILAVGMLVIYLVRSINSEEYVVLVPDNPNGPWTTRQKAHAAGVFLGWFVFISAAIQGILDWSQLSTSPENVAFLGVLVAFASLSFLGSFQSASYEKRELSVTREALSWILYELNVGSRCINIEGVAVDTRKMGLIEKVEAELSNVSALETPRYKKAIWELDREVANARACGTERYKKEFILSAARSVQRYYEDLEEQIGRQLIREQERSKHEARDV